jgi:hypothetical protein
MRATHLIAAMLGIIAAALIAVLLAPGFAGSAQAPLPVIEQKNPAFQPFQTELAPKSPFCGEIDVPAGRRLVIEFVSGAFEETQRRTVTVVTTVGGEAVRHFIKLPEFNPDIETIEGGQAVRLYADPSTRVRACIGGGLGVISLSGYLVTLP